MIMDMEEFASIIENYPEIRKSTMFLDATQCFKYIIGFKNKVPTNLYAFYLRLTYQRDTYNVPLSVQTEAFENVEKELLMYQEEIELYKRLPEQITIYRGTDIMEDTPRLSWSLKKEVAMQYFQGRLFKATIEKEKIFAYFSANTDEEEIVAYVPKDFEIAI